jgi:hypothetical protein
LEEKLKDHPKVTGFKFRHISDNSGFHVKDNLKWGETVDPDFKKLSKKGAKIKQLQETKLNTKTVQGATNFAYFYNTKNHIKILVSEFNGYYNDESELKGKKGYGG